MKISSSAFSNMSAIPSKYTCDGDNINPPLYFEDIPKGTKSFVLIVDDPDVPKNIREDGLWVHWVVFNIAPSETQIGAGEMPNGIPGRNTWGSGLYEGPCPPDREHRYFFKLFALDTTLDLSPGSTAAEVDRAMKGHVIGNAELVGKYERSMKS